MLRVELQITSEQGSVEHRSQVNITMHFSLRCGKLLSHFAALIVACVRAHPIEWDREREARSGRIRPLPVPIHQDCVTGATI